MSWGDVDQVHLRAGKRVHAQAVFIKQDGDRRMPGAPDDAGGLQVARILTGNAQRPLKQRADGKQQLVYTRGDHHVVNSGLHPTELI